MIRYRVQSQHTMWLTYFAEAQLKTTESAFLFNNLCLNFHWIKIKNKKKIFASQELSSSSSPHSIFATSSLDFCIFYYYNNLLPGIVWNLNWLVPLWLWILKFFELWSEIIAWSIVALIKLKFHDQVFNM